MAIKNKGIVLPFFVLNTSTSIGVTGLTNTELTLKLYKDGVEDATFTSSQPTITELTNGHYKITLSDVNMNADTILVNGVCTEADCQVIYETIITEQGSISTIDGVVDIINSGGAKESVATTNKNEILSSVDSVSGDIVNVNNTTTDTNTKISKIGNIHAESIVDGSSTVQASGVIVKDIDIREGYVNIAYQDTDNNIALVGFPFTNGDIVISGADI